MIVLGNKNSGRTVNYDLDPAKINTLKRQLKDGSFNGKLNPFILNFTGEMNVPPSVNVQVQNNYKGLLGDGITVSPMHAELTLTSEKWSGYVVPIEDIAVNHSTCKALKVPLNKVAKAPGFTNVLSFNELGLKFTIRLKFEGTEVKNSPVFGVIDPVVKVSSEGDGSTENIKSINPEHVLV